MAKMGGEVASHGSTHKNNSDEIANSIRELKNIGINVCNIGFASPESWLTYTNLESTGINEFIKNGAISYIRSGIQIKREGIIYTILSVIEQLTHSKRLFLFLNKRNVIKCKNMIYPSVAIKNFTSLNQIQFMINTINNNEALILMFHSILPKSDLLYGKDHYYWDADRFDSLCKWLSSRKDIEVLTTRNLIQKMDSTLGDI